MAVGRQGDLPRVVAIGESSLRSVAFNCDGAEFGSDMGILLLYAVAVDGPLVVHANGGARGYAGRDDQGDHLIERIPEPVQLANISGRGWVPTVV